MADLYLAFPCRWICLLLFSMKQHFMKSNFWLIPKGLLPQVVDWNRILHLWDDFECSNWCQILIKWTEFSIQVKAGNGKSSFQPSVYVKSKLPRSYVSPVLTSGNNQNPLSQHCFSFNQQCYLFSGVFFLSLFFIVHNVNLDIFGSR
jgi:hypothetical protein